MPGGNLDLWTPLYQITTSVKNIGPISGASVPQLYVTFPDCVPKGTPPRQLQGFDNIMLRREESREVVFELMRRDISYWDVITQQWIIPCGDILLSVGFSSRNLTQFATIQTLSCS